MESVNIKDVIISKVTKPNTKLVGHGNELRETPEFNILVQQGETMSFFFSNVKDTLENRNLDRYQLSEFLHQIKTVLWMNMTPDNNQHKMFLKRLELHQERVRGIRGKQPRKDAERLKDIKKEMVYTCVDLIDGIVHYLD
tara:strand:+ start:216 stop:635 length:420 start_codon:yes stop_codon:yes gene_type:complete